MKDLTDKLDAIEVEGMSIAQKAAIVRQMMDYLKITNEQIEEYGKQGITEEGQKEASSNLTSVVTEVARVGLEEAKVTSVEIEPISFVNQSNRDKFSSSEINQPSKEMFEQETPINSSNKNDDNSNNSAEESKEDKEQVTVTNPQIQQFVIPLIVDRINTFGKQDKESQNIVYQGEDYTASLKLEKDTQTLSLDRNSLESEDNQKALLASKDNNSKEYSIVLNNLTQEEFERFKALFEEQQARREQNQNQTQNKESDSELG